MKSNKINASNILIILGIIFSALVIMSFYPRFNENMTKKSLEKMGIDAPANSIFVDLNKDNADEITIKSAQDNFKMEKTTEGWVLDGRSVDTAKLASLFQALTSMEIGDLLSKNPKNHLELGVSSGTGTFVNIRKGSTEYNFVVGNPSAVLNSFYFRQNDKNDVYLVKSSLRRIVTIPKNEWLDKYIVDIKFDEITKIDILSTQNFSIVRKEDGKLYKSQWGTDTEIEAEKVAQIRNILSPLEGTRYLTEEEMIEFDNAPFKNVVILYGAGDQIIHKLDVLEKAGNWWVSETGSQNVFESNTIGTLITL